VYSWNDGYWRGKKAQGQLASFRTRQDFIRHLRPESVKLKAKENISSKIGSRTDRRTMRLLLFDFGTLV
jgi:hypothetical protein